MRQERQERQKAPSAPPYAWAAAVFGFILALYVVTIAPTIQFWDTAEYVAAAYVLGIPHPPGNPLFVLLAHAWGMVPIVEHYALRVNLLAAVTSAAAAALLFLVAERFLSEVVAKRVPRLVTAFAGVLVGATSFTVWHQSVVNEKVYTVSLLSIALVLWLVVRWGDEPAGGHRDRRLVLVAYLLALTTTNHLMGLLVLPAVGVYLAYTDPGVLGRWRMWVAVLAVAAVGISVSLVLPIRAGQFPPINEGEPACESVLSAGQAVYTLGATGCEALADVLSREQYAKPPLSQRQADLGAQVANYLQYFTWQFAHDYSPPVRRALAALFGMLGLVGAVRHYRAERRGAVAMIALMATVTVLLVFYLNFRYGFSYRQGAELDREVRERDYFFIASFHLWGLWVALGLGAIVERLAGRFRTPDETPRWALGLPVLLIALVPAWGNRLSAPRSGEWFPRDFAWDLLQSVEPYGILVTMGDNDTFPLWYMQEVEGVRKDVTLVNLSLGGTLWHIRQVKRRPQAPFDSARAIPLYQERTWPVPQEPVLEMSFDQINALPGAVALGDRRVFRADGIRTVIRSNAIDRPTLAVLQLITDNVGERPIYFSRTVGGYADELGFTPYLVGHGLARKLMSDSIAGTDQIVHIRGQGWVDVDRTARLLFDVYHTDSVARERPRGWIDVPSENILTLYGVVYNGYARWAANATDSTKVERAQQAAMLSERILRQTSFFRP